MRCIQPGCTIDPKRIERRRVLLREEGAVMAWLVVNGPHPEAYAMEVKVLDEMSAAHLASRPAARFAKHG